MVRQEAVYRNESWEKSEILPYCFSGGSDGKESACNAGDLGPIPGSRRSPGGGNGNLLQYYCMENSVDRGAWWATVRGVTESDTTEQVTFSLLGGSQVEIRTLISDHLPLVGSFPFCWFSCHTSSICRQIPTWGLAKKELWSKDTEIDFLFFFSMGFLTESKTLSVNTCLLSTHTREWHCYAMPLKGIYTLLNVWKLTFTGWKTFALHLSRILIWEQQLFGQIQHSKILCCW